MSTLVLRPVQWLLGLFPRGKNTEEWNRQLTTFSAKFKNEWSYTFPPQYAFMARKEENFIFVIIELFDAARSELLAGSLNKP